MKIGMIGLGRLGLPVAVAMDLKGNEVFGYDINLKRMSTDAQEYVEAGPDGKGDFNDYLKDSKITFCESIHDIALKADLLFVAVQTPHEPSLDGTKPFFTEDLKDFDYRWLCEAIRDISVSIDGHSANKSKGKPNYPVAIISTALPGTYERHIKKFVSDNIDLYYNPFFIAMGSVMQDFLNPEFVLIGSNKDEDNILSSFYESFMPNTTPIIQMSIPSAEATKVLYNTYISAKIGVVTVAQMVCDQIDGCNINDVLKALRHSNVRLLGEKYMMPGMGDGGGCHPRDNLALGWLMRDVIKRPSQGNLFANIMHQRTDYAWYIAERLLAISEETNLQIGIYGYSFKANTAITDGSHALLVNHILTNHLMKRVVLFDPIIHGDKREPYEMLSAKVWLIGANHDNITLDRFHPDSVILDPWHLFAPSDKPRVETIG